MYRTVLAAVNEHVNSEIAGRYALQLARTARARILFCSIHEPGKPEQTFELAKESARRLQHRAHELETESECLFEAGDPADRLRSIVERYKVDILFAAMRRHEARRRIPPGKHAARELFRFPCAVALVRVVHMGRTHPNEVLIPLKEHIGHIPERAEFAALLARSFDAKVHLFHVARPRTLFFLGEAHLTPREWEANVPPDISRFIGHLDGHGVAHEKRMAPGRAGKSIAIEAASRRRDLIIMGASSRGLLGLLRGGDPVKEVLRETPCNVIIFKPGE